MRSMVERAAGVARMSGAISGVCLFVAFPHVATLMRATCYPAHELGDIIRHLRLNRKALLDAWNEHFGA